MRVTLGYDEGLRTANTWHLERAASAILGVRVRARIRVASAQEVTVEIAVRRANATGYAALARAFIRDLDGTSWLMASADHHPDLPRMEMVLTGAPDEVNAALRAAP